MKAKIKCSPMSLLCVRKYDSLTLLTLPKCFVCLIFANPFNLSYLLSICAVYPELTVIVGATQQKGRILGIATVVLLSLPPFFQSALFYSFSLHILKLSCYRYHPFSNLLSSILFFLFYSTVLAFLTIVLMQACISMFRITAVLLLNFLCNLCTLFCSILFQCCPDISATFFASPPAHHYVDTSQECLRQQHMGTQTQQLFHLRNPEKSHVTKTQVFPI